MQNGATLFAQSGWLVVGILILVVVNFLPRPILGKRAMLKIVFGGVIGLLGFVGLSDFAFSRLGWVRDGELVKERYFLPPVQTDQPVILFVGSSYTDLGLNPALVRDELLKHGIKAQVIARGAGGASRLEQWQFVQEVMALLAEPPLAVFFEVSLSYDQRPVYGLKSPLSTRALTQFDWQGTKWALDALWWKNDETLLGLEHKDEIAGALARHFLISRLNVGLGHQLVDKASFAPQASFSPRQKPKKNFDPITLQQGLKAQKWEVGQAPLPDGGPNPWALMFHEQAVEILQENGVKNVAYHVLPIASPGRRRYSFQFCRQFSDHICLNGNQRVFLDRLSADLWIDKAHLREAGSDIYSKWLANEMIRSGLFDDF